MKKGTNLKTVSVIALVALSLLGGCSRTRQTTNPQEGYDSEAFHSTKNQKSQLQKNVTGVTNSDYTDLAQLNFKSGEKSYCYVNHDRAKLNPYDWKTNHVIYQQPDNLNRTSASNVGYLERRNLANGSLRVRQYIQPSGWHFNHGKQIYNRGHLIAYSVSAGINQQGQYSPNEQSGDQNNPKNLFTQTAYTNQKIQTIYENKVRQALRQNKKVIYSATPIFRGTERMARGIDLQAITTDKTLNFNVYIFNVQPGYQFNYQDGRARIDHTFKVDGLSDYDSNDWNKNYNSTFKRHLIRSRKYLKNHYWDDYQHYQQKRQHLQRYAITKKR